MLRLLHIYYYSIVPSYYDYYYAYDYDYVHQNVLPPPPPSVWVGGKATLEASPPLPFPLFVSAITRIY